MSGVPSKPTDAVVVALLLFYSALKESGQLTPGHERHLRAALAELQLVDTEGSEWDAQLCLTAFDILWARVPSEILATVESEMSDDEREVVQRAVEMSGARRLAEGML